MAKNSKVKKVAKSVWRLFVLSGVLGILFGLFAMFWPDKTVSALMFVFAVFIVAMGFSWLVMSFASMRTDRIWWLSALFAAFCMAVGIHLLANPSTTMKIFVVLVAIAVFARALVDLVKASYSNNVSNRGMWGLLGVLGVVFGVVILTHPTDATVMFVWLVGLYAFIRGVADVIYAFQVRGGVKSLVKTAKK